MLQWRDSTYIFSRSNANKPFLIYGLRASTIRVGMPSDYCEKKHFSKIETSRPPVYGWKSGHTGNSINSRLDGNGKSRELNPAIIDSIVEPSCVLTYSWSDSAIPKSDPKMPTRGS